MLDMLRRSASGFVGMAIIGILVIAFAVWGIADIFTGFTGDTVAEVGDQKIDSASYDREFRAELDRMSERLGQPLTREQGQRFGVDRLALSRLIGVATLDDAAEELGLTVGDETVGIDIMTDPNLQGAFGRFDRELFRQLLRQNGIPEERFVEQRRKGMVRRQLTDAITAGIPAPETMIDVVLRFQQETRTAGYVILPPSLVGDIEDPDEEAVQSFYEAGASAFTLPETRDFSFMEIEPEDIAQSIAISDEALREAYEQRRGEYDVPERREIQQITFATEEAAGAALETLRGGGKVETVVADLGLTVDDVDLGNVSRGEMISPELADTAFSLESGAWSEPVKGPLGWSIIHVGEITPGKDSTFAEVKDKVRKALEIEMAREQIYDIQNAIEDARAGGEPLADIAARYDLNLRSISGITEDGKTRSGDDIELPELPGLLETVYDSQIGDQNPPKDTGKEGYYWVQLDAVNPATVQPLDEVRDEVVRIWKERQRAAKLEALAAKLVERGNAGESFDEIAGDYGRSVLAMPGIQRYAQNDTFSRTAVTKLFAAPQGGFVYGPVGLGDSLLVMRVREISEPDVPKDSETYTQARANLADSLSADMLQTFVVGHQNDLGVEVNQTLLQQLTATDSGV
ncbi:MAG: SurA N-terminal domain-containing protein [Parvibaculum sp.]|jgi:peptidyl-prolyl cis-trans isomerase D|uniref:peptidyl-prolyl cis-trans isomerase n=1 Tax=Parvibaculum sp. TaxID=2024848 RepID=UPI0032EC7453